MIFRRWGIFWRGRRACGLSRGRGRGLFDVWHGSLRGVRGGRGLCCRVGVFVGRRPLFRRKQGCAGFQSRYLLCGGADIP